MADGRIVAIGECMLELCRDADGWHLGHGGDTFNTAVHLARLGEAVAFMTALADDPFSEAMRADWIQERLDSDLVLTVPGGLPGLYAIQTDTMGERSFHYWRERAAVRELFRLPQANAAAARVAQASLLYLSGITLALFNPADRARLLALALAVRRRGGQVAFDPNYRAALWPSPAAACAAIAEFAPAVSIALPTFSDDRMLYGDSDPRQTQARWTAMGVDDIVVKLGASGCMLADGSILAPEQPVSVVDTTGAGDAFNAGYLAARRRGLDRVRAAGFANTLAGSVVGHIGAVTPRSAIRHFEFPDQDLGK